jgi:predicted transporter
VSNAPKPRNISNLKNLAPLTKAKVTATTSSTSSTDTTSTPMSTGEKVAIGVGVVGVLALGGWAIAHAQKAHAGSRR